MLKSHPLCVARVGAVHVVLCKASLSTQLSIAWALLEYTIVFCKDFCSLEVSNRAILEVFKQSDVSINLCFFKTHTIHVIMKKLLFIKTEWGSNELIVKDD